MFSGSLLRRGAYRLLLPILLVLAAPPGGARADDCLECHEKSEIGSGDRSTHPPFAEDDCTACHLDHGDEERLLLAETGNALCESCHDSGGDLLKSHRGIRGNRASCLSCHDPHRSAQERLLRPELHRPLAFGRCEPCHRYDGRLLKPTVKELCLGCHGGEEFSRRITHAPVGKGECLACHDPHGSREPALLKGRYTPGRWAAGEGDFALCLNCHNRESFTAARPEHTQFRSGGQNYHALHVTGKPSRGASAQAGRALACRNCHEVHTSTEPRLIRRELDCGGVPCLRLEFSRTDAGGECLSGCHAPQSYSFAEPGRPAPAPAVQVAAPARELPAQFEPSPLERSINKRCVSCHEKAVQGFVRKHVHAPVRAGFCSACHLDHGPENRLILLGKQERICAKCHALTGERMEAAHHGFPLAGSRCTECHDPHSSEDQFFLYPRRHEPFAEADCGACHGSPAAGWKIGEEVNEVCSQCHEEVATQPVLHTAVPKKRCTGCHQPHLSREPALLREPRATLCFRCHDRQRFALETVHPPVQDGECAACHPAHGSAIPRLLARPYPLEQFVPFAEEKYALCWECHDAASLTDAAQPGATGFSDGKRNLHALHLLDRSVATALGSRAQPGVSCRNCHDPHATENPRLIRRVLDCNGVPCLQVEFHQVGAGGKCLGGCHDTKSYLPE